MSATAPACLGLGVRRCECEAWLPSFPQQQHSPYWSASLSTAETAKPQREGGTEEKKDLSCLSGLAPSWITWFWYEVGMQFLWFEPCSMPYFQGMSEDGAEGQGGWGHWPLKEPSWGEEDENINLLPRWGWAVWTQEVKRSAASIPTQTTSTPSAELTVEVVAPSWRTQCLEPAGECCRLCLSPVSASPFYGNSCKFPVSALSDAGMRAGVLHARKPWGWRTPWAGGAHGAEEITQAIVYPANAFSRCFVWKSTGHLAHLWFCFHSS